VSNNDIPGDYIAGLVDGEGCFHFSASNGYKNRGRGDEYYPTWRYSFVIRMEGKEEPILYEVQKVVRCGKVNKYPNSNGNRKPSVAFSVENLSDLHDKVIPFFKKYLLRASKRHNFEVWSEAITKLYIIRNRPRSNVGNKVNISNKERHELMVISEQLTSIQANRPGRKKIDR